MKKLIAFLLIISAVFTAVSCGKDESDGSIGITLDIPDFTVYKEDGEDVRFHSMFKGNPVVLNVWGEWCPWCIKELPDFEEAYRSNPGVDFVMVNYGDKKADALEFIAEGGYTFPVFYDLNQEVPNVYEISNFPTTFFFSGDGKLIKKYVGMLTADVLEAYIKIISEN